MSDEVEYDENPDPVAQVITYLALVLKHVGGEVTIPYSEIVEGLPTGHGVQMEQLDSGDLVMRISAKNGQ